MAYQNVGTPRFYVDHLLWLKTLGLEIDTLAYGGIAGTAGISDFIGLNPAKRNLVNYQGADYPDIYIKYPAAPSIATADNQWKAYVAILGHNAASVTTGVRASVSGIANFNPSYQINYDYTGPPYNGFSLAYDFEYFPDLADYLISFRLGESNTAMQEDFYIGCLSHGNYYDMPHSPELSLTMSREMDGVKKIRTKGGVDLVDRKYTKPPLWANGLAPWEIGGTGNHALSRFGRRSWDLSFNHLAGSSLYPEIAHVPYYEYYDPDGNEYPYYTATLLDDDNFLSQVIHKTNGGQLPFIFQPDNSSTAADNFAICKFDMDSFSFEQVAGGIYNMKLKIREVW